ncbi:hypothetical protein JCM11491_001231 [Sporobolomyces phaffii]
MDPRALLDDCSSARWDQYEPLASPEPQSLREDLGRAPDADSLEHSLVQRQQITIRRRGLRRTPSPPSASSRFSRIRFVDASYQPDGRDPSTSRGARFVSTVEAGAGGEMGWSPRRRKSISATQLEILLDVFAQIDRPNLDVRQRLSAELDMTPREVQVWFQNRRAKVKREGTGGSSSEPCASGARQPDPAQVGGQALSDGSFSAGPPSVTDSAHSDADWKRWTPPPASTGPPEPDVPRYRRVFGDRRISLPESFSGSFGSNLSPQSGASTSSSSSSSYFSNRILPSPGSRGSSDSGWTDSPGIASDRTLLCLPGRNAPECDPFFPQLPLRAEPGPLELIHLAPILESIRSDVFSVTQPPPMVRRPSLRRHSSLDDLFNPRATLSSISR